MEELNNPGNTRRDFIKKTAMAGAGLTMGGLGFTAKSYASIPGANDRITMAVIGIHGQGQTHINSWCGLKSSKNVRLENPL